MGPILNLDGYDSTVLGLIAIAVLVASPFIVGFTWRTFDRRRDRRGEFR